MLSVLTSRRKWRNFLVYDLEWIPGTLQVRMVGVFDGNRYRWYKTVEDFLACELNRENRGKWFYAHAGGLADIQFLFEKLIGNPSFSVKASFSGSSAIIVHVGKGETSRNIGVAGQQSGSRLGHDLYHFIDSYWLLRDTLRNIGKNIGLEKGGEELRNDGTDEERAKAWFRDVGIRELVTYNEQDCVILWKAIEALQLKLWQFGGQLQMTLASSAMQLFRRQYLTQDIATDDRVNEVARLSYVASRVEVFEKECRFGFYHDVNSSFPFSMTKSLPGELKTSGYGRLPKAEHYLADCEFEVPETHLPPLPFRIGGRIFFPVGRWRAWLNNVDVDLLLTSGCKLYKVRGTYSFEPFSDLRDYVLDLYQKRKESKDDFEKYSYKLLLNSLYGKFAESDVKSGLVVNPSWSLMQTFDPELTQMLMPGVFLHPEIVQVPHMHVPISSHTTANSRRLLYDFLAMSSRYHYADTDGFSSEDIFPSTGELGGLKLEKIWKQAHFAAPKLYHGEGWEKKEGNWKPLVVTKAKGFSLGKDEAKAKELFWKLVESGEIQVTRMERVRSILRGAKEHGLAPRESKVVKSLSGSILQKRFFYPDGTTRPWHVRELQEAYATG